MSEINKALDRVVRAIKSKPNQSTFDRIVALLPYIITIISLGATITLGVIDHDEKKQIQITAQMDAAAKVLPFLADTSERQNTLGLITLVNFYQDSLALKLMKTKLFSENTLAAVGVYIKNNSPDTSIQNQAEKYFEKPETFVGQIVTFCGNFSPWNWNACDGSKLQIRKNTQLFSVLDTTYGGNGKTDFGLPNVSPAAENGPLSNNICLKGLMPSQKSSLFTGMICEFAYNSLPKGFAACNGQLLSIEDNRPLFDRIKTTYGGDGKTKFAVPSIESRDKNGHPLSYGIFLHGDDSSKPKFLLGMISAFACNCAPNSFTGCNGQLLNISSNPALFSVIGTRYGGDGITSFALPRISVKDTNGRPVYYYVCLNGIYPTRN